MAIRILFEIGLFLLPFAVFGVYRMLTVGAEAEGRKTWPITSLFAVGAALAAGVWIYIVVREDSDTAVCREPARFEDGVLIPAREYPCDPRIEDVGVPRPETQAEEPTEPNGDTGADG